MPKGGKPYGKKLTKKLPKRMMGAKKRKRKG